MANNKDMTDDLVDLEDVTEEDVTDQIDDGGEDEIDESVGSDTLKPGSKGPTRVQMLSTFIKLMNDLEGDDLSKFHNDSMALIGKEARNIPGGAASKNANTIKAKPSAAVGKAVKEDFDEAFEGEDLTEETKARAATLFEAAVEARVGLERASLVEELEARFDEDIEEFQTEMTDRVDSYLDYVVENWVKENEVAIEAGIRTEVAENFMEGLKNLFVEHYIEIPESKVDVVEELDNQINEMEESLNDSIEENIHLKGLIENFSKEQIFSQMSEGLVATQVEKFRTLSEGLEFSDPETFTEKLDVIKNKYFNESKSGNTQIITEDVIDNDDADVKEVPPHMKNYVDSISKTVGRGMKR